MNSYWQSFNWPVSHITTQFLTRQQLYPPSWDEGWQHSWQLTRWNRVNIKNDVSLPDFVKWSTCRNAGLNTTNVYPGPVMTASICWFTIYKISAISRKWIEHDFSGCSSGKFCKGSGMPGELALFFQLDFSKQNL